MELQEKSASKTTLDNQERREIIAKRVRSEEPKDNDMVAFLQLDAKLAGDLTEKSEIIQKGDPNAPIEVNLPLIVMTPRKKKG